MRKNSVSRSYLLLLAAIVITLLVGSFAYFTDRVAERATITTPEKGVDIVVEKPDEVEPDDPTKDPDEYEDPTPEDPEDDLNNWWAWLNSRAIVNFNPGDKMILSYKLVNAGDLAVDIRETFVVESSVPLAQAPEFRLFTDYTKAANGTNVGVDVVVKEERIDATHYMYTVAPYALSGNDADEVLEGIKTYADKEYYLVFDGVSDNSFQNATCAVSYVVEAKQHTDNPADWAIAATGELTIGDQTIPVVPAA